MMDRGPFIQTHTGIKFYPLDPRVEDIDIEDIAHALSQICRFTGHTLKFSSVCEHSIAVSKRCKPVNKLWGLLHDASEAYLGDVSSPLKSLLPEYKAIEERVQRAVAMRFGLSWPMPQDVHDSDLRMLVVEAEPSLGRVVDLWTDKHRVLLSGKEAKPRFYKPKVAKRLFLTRFYELQSMKCLKELSHV